MVAVMARKVETDRVETGSVHDDMNSLPGPKRVRVAKVGSGEVREGEGLRQARKALKTLGVEERRGNLTRTQMPTVEQARRGVYEVVKGERFDTARKDETVLVNGASRARGAATMYARKQISKRERDAAEHLCSLFERSQLSQLSGGSMSERVDGGAVDTSGQRLQAAAKAYGEYRDALETLTRAGRVLVENVVVAGMAMEDAVQMRTVAHRMGTTQNPDTLRTKAFLVLGEALECLADHFGLAAS